LAVINISIYKNSIKNFNNKNKFLSNFININIETNDNNKKTADNNNYKITNSYILNDYKKFNNFDDIGFRDNNDIKKCLKNFNKNI
jgi:hypothetical protein